MEPEFSSSEKLPADSARGLGEGPNPNLATSAVTGTATPAARDLAPGTTFNAASVSLEQLRLSAEQLATRAMRLYRIRAALWLAIGMLVVSGALVAVDYVLHAEERGLRWLLTAVCVTAWGYLIYRFVKVAWPRAIDPVACARWVEQREPQWRGQLSALVALAQLPESDDRYGSASFRHAAMMQHSQLALQTDWHSYIDIRPTIRAAIGLTSLVIAVLALCAVWPSIAGRGFVRMMAPWVYAPWPRADELQMVDLPEVMALGRELEVQVIDRRPPLPATVQLELRTENSTAQKTEVRSVPMRVLGELAVVALPEMRSNFQLRAVGGDDTNGPWREVRVAELPAMTEQHFLVQPPEYTGQPASELIGQRIEVLSGSKVIFRGKFSGPMRSVVAQSVGTPPSVSAVPSNATTANPTPGSSDNSTLSSVSNVSPATNVRLDSSWKAVLSSDGTAFELFTGSPDEAFIERERRWQLKLETADGLEAVDPTNWSIRVNPDRPPQVNFASVEPQIVTRQASVQIAGSASDDLGLARVDLVWRSDASELLERKTLWQSSGSNDAQVAGDANGQSAKAIDRHAAQRSATVSTTWRPESQRLTTGQSVTLMLEAVDSKGQVSQSVPQTLEIRGNETVLADAQSNKGAVLEPLGDLLENQLRNVQAVARARDILNGSDTPPASQLEALASARQLEQAIAQQVSRSPASILSKLKELSRRLDLNALGDSQVARELSEIEAAIATMSDQAIEPALQRMEASFNTLRDAVREGSEKKLESAREQLQSSLEAQQQVAASMKRLLGSVTNSESMVEVQKRLQRLLSDQKSLREETERLQVQSLAGGNRAADLDAKRIGLRSDQQNLARSIEDIASLIDAQLASEAASTDSVSQTTEAETTRASSGEPQKAQPSEDNRSTSQVESTGQSSGARSWNRIQRVLSDERIASRMRDASERVESKQFADAMQIQSAIVQSLESLTAGLSGSSAGNLANAQADLQVAADRIGELAQRQQLLSQQMAALAQSNEPNTLENQQPANQQASNPLKSQLVQQQQEVATEIKNAQEQWPVRAGEAIRQSLQTATELAESAASQSHASDWQPASQSGLQAAEKLRESQAAARSRAEALDKQMATQKLLDLKTRVTQLLEQQSPLVDSLQATAASQASGSAPPATVEKAIREAATIQERIRKQLVAGQPESDQLDTFAWLLDTSQQEMARSVAALERGRLVTDGLDASTSALDRLSAAAEALAATTGRSPNEDPKHNGEETKQDSTASEDQKDSASNLPSLASLRLLRAMQAKINQRTSELLGSGVMPGDIRLERLADQQNDLARQAEKLLTQLQTPR